MGDNMFSAHTVFLTVPMIALQQYVIKIRWIKYLTGTIYSLLVMWIIASHLHYTADVVIALYLSALTWFAFQNMLPIPLKDEKDLGRIIPRPIGEIFTF